ncbi:hypothetical protein FRX31_013991, partial [Thalictrum thalictroides]
MMQSRTRWIASFITHKRFPFLLRSTSSTSRTAHPNVHSRDTEGIDAENRVLVEQEREVNYKFSVDNKNQQPLKPSSSFATSAKIESTA